jgi:hypothetical protein
MRSMGIAALAVLALIGGHMEQAGAGGKWWKKNGCGGCSAPVAYGCYGPSCSGPYSYGCSGCFAPSCSTPYGCSGCSQPAYYAPNCGGCSGGVYGCAYGYARPEYNPYVYLPNPAVSGYAVPTYGCGCAAGGYRPEYAPYVYQPNPYVNTYGVGAPIYTGAAAPQYSTNARMISAYNAPVAPSMATIPPLPPAEDVLW